MVCRPTPAASAIASMVRPTVPRVRSSSKVTSRIASRAAALRRRPGCCLAARGRAGPPPAGSGAAGADAAWSSPVPVLIRASLAVDETKGPDKESTRLMISVKFVETLITGKIDGDGAVSARGLSGCRRPGRRRRLPVRGYLVAGYLVATMASDQRGDLARDADRRASDQLPGPCDPDEETADDQDRDRVHVPGVGRIGD